jgi:hypothetical protein
MAELTSSCCDTATKGIVLRAGREVGVLRSGGACRGIARLFRRSAPG